MDTVPTLQRLARPPLRVGVYSTLALNIFLASWCPAFAAPTSVECRWAAGPITIDGKADEPAWQAAQVIENFRVPGNLRPAKTGTRARLLWDRENLYFFAEMEDADLYADVTQHNGFCWLNDVFELFFKPAADKPGYYEFEVNAANAVLDVFMPRRGAGGFMRFKAESDFHLETKVVLNGTLNQWQDVDKGWSVEGRIPWRDFIRAGGRPDAGERWKFALCRYDYSVAFEGPETSSCAPLDKPDFHRYEKYATLRFVGPPKGAEARLFGMDSRVALTTSRVTGSPEPSPPYRVQRVFPKLKIPFAVNVVHQPGSDFLLTTSHIRNYAHTAVVRFHDDPAVEQFETLLEDDWVFYDIVFHPRFAENGWVFISGQGPTTADGPQRVARVTRYTMQTRPPYALDVKSAKVIIEWPSNGHDGAAMAFGPDGMFYVTSGDGTSDSDTNVVGQDLTKLTAKLLRIDVDHPDAGRAYSVPRDNPFLTTPGARPETWAYGFRNPWRMTIDGPTGQIWVGQNGQDLWESAYLVQRGANYGWSVIEGSHAFYLNRQAGPTPFSAPTVEHPHSEFRSLTGGIVYRGTRLSELRGAYIYGDYSTGRIWGARHDGGKLAFHGELTDTALAITGFGTDSHGELIVADFNTAEKGGFYALEPNPKAGERPRFPARLSDTGLFKSVAGHVMQPGVIAYDVNAPQWADGASKQRYLALPGDSRIEFTSSSGWNFPDGAVLLESLALELEEGKPASRRWIETRLLTRQDGEWAGYSYVWNDEQTDATLVEKNGTNRVFSIRVPRSAEHPDGVRQQMWSYTSRADCLICHSRAANFVLGLNVLQMNRDRDYGGVVDNQLRVLEHLGMFRVNHADETRAALRDEARARGMTDKEVGDYVTRITATRDQREPAPSTLLAMPPEKYPHLVNPYDARHDLAMRARSYLQANCAHCHTEGGGGNSQMELTFTTPLEKTRLVDVKPLHHTFNLPGARLVASGSPERSVILARIGQRESGHMPPLGTYRVDDAAVKLLREWTTQLKPVTSAAQ